MGIHRNLVTGIALCASAFFFLVSVHKAEAVLSSPALQNPTSNCTGASPFVTLAWSGVAGATSYDIFRDGDANPMGNTPNVTFDDAALQAREVHTYFIKAKTATETSNASNTVSLTVGRCGTAVSLQSKSCTLSGPNMVLSWIGLAGVARYDIYRDGNLIGSRASDQTTYADGNVAGAHPYVYTVRAVWSGETKDSNEFALVTPACAPTLSAIGTCNAPGAQAELSWNGLPGVTEYHILKNNAFLDKTTNTAFKDTTARQTQTYSYQVKALYGITDSADSNAASFSMPRCPPVLRAQSACDPTNPTLPQVSLLWSATADATDYDIQNDISGYVGQAHAPDTAFTDANPQNNTTYRYTADAKGLFTTLRSNEALVATSCALDTIPVPDPVLTSVVPLCRSGAPQMDVSWVGSSGTKYYRVDRTNQTSGAIASWNVANTQTSLATANFESNTSYAFRVSAVGNGGEAQSNSITKTTPDCTPPGTPAFSDPTALCTASSKPAVDLSWSDASNASSYQIVRNGILLQEIADQSSGPYSFRDTDALPNASYGYEIIARGLGGSTPSGSKTVATYDCTAPSAPNLSLAAPVCSATTASILLNWTAAANVSYYDIYQKATGEANFTRILSGRINPWYTAINLAQNTEYQFFVMAVGPGGSTPSDLEIRSVPLCPPTTPAITGASNLCSAGKSAIQINWSDTQNTNSYEVRRSDNTFLGETLYTSPHTFTDDNYGAGLTIGSTYQYIVAAINSGGRVDSTPSNSITAVACTAPGQPQVTGSTACVGLGSAVLLNGVNQYVYLGSKSAFSLANNFSLEAWVYPTGAGSHATNGGIIFNKENAYQVARFSDGTIRWAFKNTAPGWTTWINTSVVAPLNQWTHLVVIYSKANGIRTYANGLFAHTYSGSGNVTVNGAALWIGGRNSISQYFQGAIDEARLYNRELGASEITAHYNAGAGQYGVAESGLVGGWHGDEGSGIDALDYSGSGNTGTLMNGATRTKGALEMPGAPATDPRAKLSWPPTINTVSYDITRGGSRLANLLYNAATTLYSYFDPGPLAFNTSYVYRVVANGASGAGTTPSNDITITTPATCAPAKVILNVASQCSAGKAVFVLNWADPTPGSTTSYEIYRDGDVNPIARLNPPTTTYTDDNQGLGFAADSSHTYKISAVGPGGTTVSDQATGIASRCAAPGKPIVSGVAASCSGGGSVNFNGTDAYANFGAPAAFNLSKDFSLEAWVYPKSAGSGTIMSKDGVYRVGRALDGAIRWSFRNANPGWVWTKTTGMTPANQWTHVVITYSANAEIRTYINGAPSHTLSGLGNVAANSNPFWMGAENSTTQFLNGSLDEVRVYNRTLSPEEISSHFQGGIGQYGSAETGLAAAWHFNEQSGNQAQDYSGGGNSGTLMGGTQWSDSPVAITGALSGPFAQEELSWGAAASAVSYELWRGTKKIATISDTKQANYRFADRVSPVNLLTVGATYTYRVSAVNQEGVHTDSDLTTSPPLPACKPTTPLWQYSYPAAMCTSGELGVELRWTYEKPYENIANFDIERDDGAGFKKLTTVPSGGTGSQTFIDNSTIQPLVPGVSYAYRIRAAGSAGSSPSSDRSAQTFSCIIDAMTTTSQCTQQEFNPVVHLSWSRTVGNSSYFISKKPSGGAETTSYQAVDNYSVNSPTALREWLLLGTFVNSPDPSGLDIDYIDADSALDVNEASIKPRAGEIVNGKTWKRVVTPSITDFIDLEGSGAFGAQDNVVAYAFAYVVNTTTASINGELRTGSSDGVKAYVNGIQVFRFAGPRAAAARDQDNTAITLVPGVNTILLKISERNLSWGFYARLTDSAGNPLLSTITGSDSGAVKGQVADYYVWTPGLVSSPVEQVSAPVCAPGKPEVTLRPFCEDIQSVMEVKWNATENTKTYRVKQGTVLRATQTSATPFQDKNIEEKKSYTYTVEANGSGVTISDPITKTSATCTTIPDPPILTQDSVVNKCAGTSPRVVLTWQNVANAISYTTHRSADDGATYTKLPSLPPSSGPTTTFTDGSATNNTAYQYKVEAIGTGGSSFSDPPVATKTLDCSGPPIPPLLYDLNEANIVYPTHVFLSWSDRSYNEQGFRIYRSVLTGALPSRVVQSVFSHPLLANLFSAVSPIKLAELLPDVQPEDATFYLDQSAAEDTRYEYYVSAYNQAGEGNSNHVQIKTPIPPPGDFTVQASCNLITGDLELDWSPGAATTPKGGVVSYNAYWGDENTNPANLLLPPCSPDITGTSCIVPAPKRERLAIKVTAKNNGGATDSATNVSCRPPSYREVLPF